MGRIVTFYSYKGGVGRSMALANVALLLAQRGLKVLAVDCDLEAPGLERYFGQFEQRVAGAGFLRMVSDVVARGPEAVDYRRYCSTVETGTPHPLQLLASGREQDEDYSRALEHFDWGALFARHGGGAFFERLRSQWLEDHDLVLVDSRTGLSDTGGICTIQLPDVVVAMFTANFQSLYGVRDVMRLAQSARQALAYDRMPLTVLPLPTRWGMQEFQETQLWLDRVVAGMAEFFEDWLPRPLTARDVIERLRVPQQDFFGFGERLAVVEQGVAQPGTLGFVYDRVATLLAQDFQEVPAALGMGTRPPATVPAAPAASPPVPAASANPSPDRAADYDHDVYVSFDHGSTEWVLDLVEMLRAQMSLMARVERRFFVDAGEIMAGELWAERIERSITRSRVMLCVMTPRWALSNWCQRELQAFVTHQPEALAEGRVVPVMLRRTEPPPPLDNIVFLDLSDVKPRPGRSMRADAAAYERVIRLAHALEAALERAG